MAPNYRIRRQDCNWCWQFPGISLQIHLKKDWLDLEHKDSVMGKDKFQASVASETKTSNNCSSNKEGTINAIVHSFFITSYM